MTATTMTRPTTTAPTTPATTRPTNATLTASTAATATTAVARGWAAAPTSVEPDPTPTPEGWVFAGPDGAEVDAGTHEGLRVALDVIETSGWQGPAGRAVLAALSARCQSWAGRRAFASHVASGMVDPGEVLSLAWCTLARFSPAVRAAQTPWAYLWTCVSNALAVDIAAGEVLSYQAVTRPSRAWPTRVVRAGIDTDTLDPATPTDDDPDEGLSPAAAAIVAHLAGGDDAAAQFWADAVGRALDVMAAARRSYEEHALRRDPYLRDVLGLSGAELSTLAALLIGPRRGDRAAQSLLLALHRDPTTDPATVTGASARIAFLTARDHATTTTRTGQPSTSRVVAA